MNNRIYSAILATVAIVVTPLYATWLSDAIRDHAWWTTLGCAVLLVLCGVVIVSNIRDFRKTSR